ncbi:MAG: glycosyltransferase family 2 protein [Chthoniobacterales bacterium]
MTKRFDDLTLATTVHNNVGLCVAMLRSFDANVGSVAGIIVVDDASAMPPQFPSFNSPVFTLRNETPLGFCKAADRALREVQTNYALLVDADVLFGPGDFERGYNEFKKNHWAWINFRQTNFEGVPQSSYEHPLMPPWVFAAGNQVFAAWQKLQRPPKSAPGERIATVDAAHSSCALVNMETFRAVGGFDLAYAQCQSDVDLSLRLRDRDYRVGVDLGYTVKHHGAGGKSGDFARVHDLYRARVRLYERAYPRSRFYLRPLLLVRHALELGWFGLIAPFKKDARLNTRVQLLKGVWKGYH